LFWAELFSEMATECHFTPTQVREMTLHDVGMIYQGWRTKPPLRALVHAIAIAMGMKPPEDEAKPKRYMTADEARRLMAITGGRL